MRRGLAWLTGGLGVAGLLLYRRLRRAPAPEPAPAPHAEELRRKLDETRAREDAPAPESALTDDLETRRREVHERGRAAVDEMGGSTSPE